MIEEYPFLYETHLHTSQSSACAHNSGKEMAMAAKQYGYTGIVVTDHNWGGNTCIPKSLPWGEWVDEFAKGYYDARECGDKIDLDVFWGYEAGYNGTEFLIHGTTPEWLKAHPELRDATVEEQFEIVHNCGGIVVHAHPYREEYYIPEIRLFPKFVDAVEGVNAIMITSNVWLYAINQTWFKVLLGSLGAIAISLIGLLTLRGVKSRKKEKEIANAQRENIEKSRSSSSGSSNK